MNKRANDPEREKRKTWLKLHNDNNAATGQLTHTIHPKKGDNPLETLTPLTHRKRTQQSMGQTNKQRVSRDTVTNTTPNPNPGSPQNGHATWRDIIKLKIKKEGLIKGKRNQHHQHNNKSTRKWTGKLTDEVVNNSLPNEKDWNVISFDCLSDLSSLFKWSPPFAV